MIGDVNKFICYCLIHCIPGNLSPDMSTNNKYTNKGQSNENKDKVWSRQASKKGLESITNYVIHEPVYSDYKERRHTNYQCFRPV